MGKAFKNIGFMVIVVMISMGIYWLIYVDKVSKQDTLEYAMHLLGDDLLAMVPEGPAKQKVQKRFDDFTSDAKSGNVSAEQVETVSANILNLRNSADTITPDQAEALLDLSLKSPVRFSRGESESAVNREERLSENTRDSLGQHIKILHRITGQLRKSACDSEKRIARFRVAEDLKLAIDAEIQAGLLESEMDALALELKMLEKERLIEWRKDFDEDFKMEMEEMKRELESLKELAELDIAKELDELDLEALEALKDFVPPVINADSIKALVHKTLQEAGIMDAEMSINEAKIDSIERTARTAALKGLELMHESLKSLETLDFVPFINADSIRAAVEKELQDAGLDE